jgi:hypothetical protein
MKAKYPALIDFFHGHLFSFASFSQRAAHCHRRCTAIGQSTGRFE